MKLQQRINAFVKLGEFLSQFSQNTAQKKEHIANNEAFFEEFQHQFKLAEIDNGWFTEENIFYALENWSKALNINNIMLWLEKYDFKDIKPKNVAIIMAGNIPLVGFHDFISVLISGHHVIVKQSSNDKRLLPFLANYLISVEPDFENIITFTEEKLQNFDAIIATGSNNTARYFKYYFKDWPSIIRKNRNSVAIITGNETDEDLKSLSEDIFRYFGLGCRNVSKLFVPKDYNFDGFFNAMYDWNPIINQIKYANNYDYNKAVYLMSDFNILDNGFLMIKEDEGYASPISVVFYEFYDSLDQLNLKLKQDEDLIQCIVSKNESESHIPFGKTQKPELWDYADDVDTIGFLLKI